jgi:hypothetical protein
MKTKINVLLIYLISGVSFSSFSMELSTITNNTLPKGNIPTLMDIAAHVYIKHFDDDDDEKNNDKIPLEVQEIILIHRPITPKNVFNLLYKSFLLENSEKFNSCKNFIQRTIPAKYITEDSEDKIKWLHDNFETKIIPSPIYGHALQNEQFMKKLKEIKEIVRIRSLNRYFKLKKEREKLEKKINITESLCYFIGILIASALYSK